ncbi:hypothetical protein VTH06DRAFT_4607 [Thermothelomyces fergusii]
MSSAQTTTTSKPPFSLYLLPSLRMPFIRRRASRPSSAGDTSSSRSASPPESPASTCPTSPITPTSARRLSRPRPDTLRCRTCSADLAFHSQIMSKCFTGRNGRAYLVAPPSPHATPSCPASPLNSDDRDSARPDAAAAAATSADSTAADLVNIRVGEPETRSLITGVHVVADISCAVCGTTVGWKYLEAREWSQKYKVGKFILETRRVVTHRGWEDVVGGEDGDALSAGGSQEDGGDDPWNLQRQDGDDDVIVFDSEDEDECEDMFLGVWDPKVVARRRKSKSGNARRWW